eukprot:gene7677-9183_t
MSAKKSFRSIPMVREVMNSNLLVVKHSSNKPKSVKLSVYQIILGITADTFDKSYDLNSETMKQTIASCMVGVLPGDIDSLEVDECDGPCTTAAFTASVDDEADKRLYDQMKQAGMFPQEDKLLLRYTVYVRSDFSKQELLDQLTIATSGSTFEDNLQIFSSENAAVDLYRVEVGMGMESTEAEERQLLEVDDATGPVVNEVLVNLTGGCSSRIAAAFLTGVMCALLLFYAVFSYTAPKDQLAVMDVAISTVTIV